jgi:CubicO group peptidase (beta-lactamase class C family)
VKLQGYAEPRFARVADAFAQGFERHGEVGAACCVYLGGRPVVDLWAGLADAASARPWERDTLVITFSSTKGVTAVCANRLIEQGRLNPDAPVARYWPEFAAEGKGAITLRQVLGHRAGLAEVEGEFTLDDLVAWEPITRQLARQKPQWEPGTRHGYHMRSYGWLVGEVVRRVTGLSLGRYFAREIAAPLGLDFHIGLPESLEPRVATLYPPAPGADLGALVAGVASAAAARAARVMSGPSNLFAYDARWNTRPFRAPRAGADVRGLRGGGRWRAPAVRRGGHARL